MSLELGHHPEEEQLLRYADGELPAGPAASVRSHLEVCWQCRTELQELQGVIGECVKYRKNVLERHLPAPPSPWGDLYRQFEEIDASAGRGFFIDPLLQVLQYPVRHARRWAPAAAALAIILAVVYRYTFTPAVEAAELLRKAAVAAELTPPKTRRLQVRTRTRLFTRARRLNQSLAAGVDSEASVAALFRESHYGWEDPLSARSYQAWRDQLAQRRDQVATLHDARSTKVTGYRIETSTASGELTEASIQLSAPDLIPVEARFEFRNQDWVEISEVAEDAAPPAETLAFEKDHLRPVPESAAPPARLPKTGASSTAGDELHILGALHKIGADLGDPIEVKRSGGAIVVVGVGISAERQRQLQDMLGSKPNVVLQFSEAAVPPLQPEGAASPGVGAARVEEDSLRNRMEAQLGGRRYVEQLTRQILEMSESMMSRAYALRRLAEQMPQEVESELSAPDRQLLADLYHDHIAALTGQEAEIERVLGPVLTSLGAADASEKTSPVTAGTWQASTEVLFQSARRVDKQLAQMLDVTPGEGVAEQLPAEVRRSLAQLRAGSQLCDRLTAQALRPGAR